MRFALSVEQTGFADSIDSLLSDVDTEATARSWAAGEPEPGLRAWKKSSTAWIASWPP